MDIRDGRTEAWYCLVNEREVLRSLRRVCIAVCRIVLDVEQKRVVKL